MNCRTPEERLKQAQRIVARYVSQDRDLVAELIAERRAEAAAELSEAPDTRADLDGVDDATKRSTATAQTIKSKGGGK